MDRILCRRNVLVGVVVCDGTVTSGRGGIWGCSDRHKVLLLFSLPATPQSPLPPAHTQPKEMLPEAKASLPSYRDNPGPNLFTLKLVHSWLYVKAHCAEHRFGFGKQQLLQLAQEFSAVQKYQMSQFKNCSLLGHIYINRNSGEGQF